MLMRGLCWSSSRCADGSIAISADMWRDERGRSRTSGVGWPYASGDADHTQVRVSCRLTPGSKAADKAAKAAHNAGATGPRLTAAAQVLRDQAICSRAMCAVPQKHIASEFGISERTVRDVLQRAKSAPSLLASPPADLLEDLLRAFQTTASALDVLAADNAQHNPAVALGAARSAHAARVQLLDLLIACGVLPERLDRVRAESELRAHECLSAAGHGGHRVELHDGAWSAHPQ